jgi:RNase P subunit RPR2
MVIKYDEEKFKRVCEKSDSMLQAASTLGLHFNTFKRHAKKLNVYKPNQSGKGMKKPRNEDGIIKYKLYDILNGKHPHYQTYKLKLRLLEEGIKENICEVCDLQIWEGNNINMELDHIDGDRTNHKLDNLRMICPNCHSQTETFRAKNKSLNREIY